MLSEPKIDFRLYVITDRHCCTPLSLEDAATQVCRAGVKAVQLREKDLTALEVFRLAVSVRASIEKEGASLFVNERADIAAASGARGVHLPQGGIPLCAARCCLPLGALVAVSTHTETEARTAQEEGADFITFGPVYPTPSKAAYGEPVGLPALERIAARIEIPVFAIGGVTPVRASDCIAAGAYGVAVISAILGACDIRSAVGAFEEAVGGL